jgi:hypothetical protein
LPELRWSLCGAKRKIDEKEWLREIQRMQKIHHTNRRKEGMQRRIEDENKKGIA